MLPSDQLKKINVTVDGTSFALCCPRAHNIEYVAKELFVDKQYPVFPFLQVEARVILDVGANVGCSCVWFHACYP